MDSIEKKVYTVTEIAKILGISKSYAYELVKEQKIPVLELGKRKLIPKEKFDNWLNGTNN